MSKLYSKEDEIKYRRLLKKLVNIKDLLTIEEQYLLCNYNIHLEEKIDRLNKKVNELEKFKYNKPNDTTSVPKIKTFVRSYQNEYLDYKTKCDRAIKRCKQEIEASTLQYERTHKQQHLVYKVAHERMLEILENNAK